MNAIFLLNLSICNKAEAKQMDFSASAERREKERNEAVVTGRVEVDNKYDKRVNK